MTDLPKLRIQDLLEKLAELEHERVRENRWKLCWKPYDELDEATKEFDREWARKVMALVEAEFVRIVKAHAAAYQKLLNRKCCKQEHNAKEHKIARDAVLKLTDEIKLKDLEVEGKTI